MGLETIALIGVGVAAVAGIAGAGISYYGQQQQAKNAQAIANYNAQVQQQNSDYQAKLAIRQQQINASFNQTQQNQTVALTQQADSTRAQALEDQKRNQERQRRLIATQRAGYAKAGVVLEGTPLAVLADTAGVFELQNQDISFEADSKARALEREAQLRKAGLTADASVLQLNESAARASQRIGRSQAEITRMQGRADAQGYKMASYGSLLSGVSSLGGALSSIN